MCCVLQEKARAAKPEAVEALLARHRFFTMASGNVEGVLKFYLSAVAKPLAGGDAAPSNAVDAAAAAATGTADGAKSGDLFLIELVVLLLTGEVKATLKTDDPVQLAVIGRMLKDALKPLLK